MSLRTSNIAAFLLICALACLPAQSTLAQTVGIPDADENRLSAAASHTQASSPRIVSERFAKLEDWPFFAAIRGEHPHPRSQAAFYYCGASFIHEDWLLTAAHCVVDSVEDPFTETWSHTWPEKDENGIWSHATFGAFIIVANTDDLANERQLQELGIQDVIVHPDYQPGDAYNTPLNDLALIKLNAPWKGRTISLFAGQGASPHRGFVTGFGSTGEFAGMEEFETDPGRRPAFAGSRFLKYVVLPTVTAERCSAVYSQHDPASQICAGYDRGGVDSCQGDSGGPFVYRSSSTDYQLAGVVSFGRGCARDIHDDGGYGVYASVASQTGWIESVISGLDYEAAPTESLQGAISEAITDLKSLLQMSRAAGRSQSLEVRLAKSTFRYGDELELDLVSPVDGRLLILLIDIDGNVLQLFPLDSADEAASEILAGQIHHWPDPEQSNFRIMAGPPAGTETLITLVVPHDFKLDTSVGLKVVGGEDGIEERLLDEGVFSIYSLANEVVAASQGDAPPSADLANLAWSIDELEILDSLPDDL